MRQEETMFFTKIFIILAILLAVIYAKAEPEAVRNIAGAYDIELHIQDQVFHDHLILEADRNIDPYTFNGALKGTMEVPGAFKVPLNGTGFCSFWSGYCEFNFSIMADENGEKFEVFYTMSTNNLTASPFAFEGQAFLKDHELLGPFTAVKHHE